MAQRLRERQSSGRIEDQHLPYEVEHLLPVLGAAALARDVAMQGLAVGLHEPTVRRVLVPEQAAARAEIFHFRALRHFRGDAAENPLHHGEVFGILVRLEEGDAERQLEDDAPDGPDVAGLRPAQLHDDLWGAVMPRRHNGGVVLVVEGGAAEIDQADLGIAHPSHFAPQRRIKLEVVGRVEKENVLRLEVRVGDPVAMKEVDGVAEVVGHLPNVFRGIGMVAVVFQKVEHALSEHLEGNGHVTVKIEPVQHPNAQIFSLHKVCFNKGTT